MKTTRILSSALIALVAPAVAALVLANVVSAQVALAIVASASLVAFALYDYSRNMKPVSLRAQILRPALPLRSVATTPASVTPFVTASRRAA